jgi:magnesium-transporting ATPase (P-type)
MKLWMLTGDKMETSINIGFASELLDPDMQIFKIRQHSMQEIMNYISMALNRVQKERGVAYQSPGFHEVEKPS